MSPQNFIELLESFAALPPQTFPLEEALGRFLGADIQAPEDLPPFKRSTMDGFAVRAKDTFGASESEPLFLKVIGEIPMGASGDTLALGLGECATIWTGGSLPQGADAVLMVEYSKHLDERTIEIYRAVAPGENVIQAGDDFQKGAPVLKRGRCLAPQDLGALAGLGLTRIPIAPRPVVAIISTGDELVAPDKTPQAGKIRDINSTSLAALVTEAGGRPLPLGVISDEFSLMQERCLEALEAPVDILLLSGGSSVGRRDFTLEVFKSLPNCTVMAHGVAVRPGKPTIFAHSGNQALFGLPGHAASAMVVFELFVRPLIRRFLGAAGDGRRRITAQTSQVIPSAIGREEYVRVALEEQGPGEKPTARPIYGKSGLIRPLVAADGLLKIDRDCEGLDQGETAQVRLLN